MSSALSAVSFESLNGWREANLALPCEAFRRSAQEILATATGFRRAAAFGGNVQDWIAACQAAATDVDPRLFFETYFRAFRVHDRERPEGLFTGYYEPVVRGALAFSNDYPVPVYARPRDLVAFTAAEQQETGLSYGRRVDGRPVAYDRRQDIECGSLGDKAEVLCWLSSWVDAFFMHVQGQGRVVLDDGGVIRLSYAAKSGHPYTGIGHVLVQRGVAPVEKMSMQVLRDWMNLHADEARPLMWQNKSYIFFQKTSVSNHDLGGIGAAKVNLTPGHSLAVDRTHWMFGTPMWIETRQPPEAPQANQPINRLMIAQDTGSAIKGLVRGDFFWGWGEQAEIIAGHMKSAGAMAALLPLPLALRHGHVR